MGKAAYRSRIKRQKFFSALTKNNPARFATAWEMRIQSWLYEIKKTKDCDDSVKELIFSIVDTAMSILTACGPDIYKKYAQRTYNLLCNECCNTVSSIIDQRLYKLSNFESLKYNSKKGRGPYGL